MEREPVLPRKTQISYKIEEKTVLRGYNLSDLAEEGYGLADVIFIDFQVRIPLIKEAKRLNYLMILCLDEGLSTPAAISRVVAKGHTILTVKCSALPSPKRLRAGRSKALQENHPYGPRLIFSKIFDFFTPSSMEEVILHPVLRSP